MNNKFDYTIHGASTYLKWVLGSNVADTLIFTGNEVINITNAVYLYNSTGYVYSGGNAANYTVTPNGAATPNAFVNPKIETETATEFKTINAAIAAANGTDNFVILVAPGEYSEDVVINKSNVTIIGANAKTELNHDSLFIADPVKDSIITGTVTFAAEASDVTFNGFVMKNQITISGNVNPVISHILSLSPKFSSTLDGSITITGASSNVKIDHLYIGGTAANRGVHVNALVTDFTITDSVVLDDTNLMFDFVRFGQISSPPAFAAGTITMTNCYVQTLQSGFMDRKPDTAKYVIESNTFVNTPAAIYFRANAAVSTAEYVVQYNTFINCGDIPGDWDVMAITTSETTKAAVNYNAFINCLSVPGSNTDYVIKIRTLAGTIDCANNYFDSEANKALNLNATGLTFLDDDSQCVKPAEVPAE